VADVSVDPRFERAVLAELAMSERRGRRDDPSLGARALARRLHRGRDDLLPVDLLARAGQLSPGDSALRLARDVSEAPGLAGYLARVAARAAIEDRLGGARPKGETLAALRLLPDPTLTR
jgi:hypothetical protein